MFNCPYTEIDLKMASMSSSFTAKIEDKSFEEKMKVINENSEERTTADIAKFHSLTPLELTSSPNYVLLRQQYDEYYLKKLIAQLEDAGFNNKEAWVIVAMLSGKLHG